MPEPRSNRADFDEILIAVDQGIVGVERQLRDAAVDGASNGGPGAAQLEEDARGVGPGGILGLHVLLFFEVSREQIPFLLIASPLQQLELREPRDHILGIHFGFESLAPCPQTRFINFWLKLR